MSLASQKVRKYLCLHSMTLADFAAAAGLNRSSLSRALGRDPGFAGIRIRTQVGKVIGARRIALEDWDMPDVPDDQVKL